MGDAMLCTVREETNSYVQIKHTTRTFELLFPPPPKKMASTKLTTKGILVCYVIKVSRSICSCSTAVYKPEWPTTLLSLQ